MAGTIWVYDHFSICHFKWYDKPKFGNSNYQWIKYMYKHWNRHRHRHIYTFIQTPTQNSAVLCGSLNYEI